MNIYSEQTFQKLQLMRKIQKNIPQMVAHETGIFNSLIDLKSMSLFNLLARYQFDVRIDLKLLVFVSDSVLSREHLLWVFLKKKVRPS